MNKFSVKISVYFIWWVFFQCCWDESKRFHSFFHRPLLSAGSLKKSTAEPNSGYHGKLSIQQCYLTDLDFIYIGVMLKFYQIFLHISSFFETYADLRQHSFHVIKPAFLFSQHSSVYCISIRFHCFLTEGYLSNILLHQPFMDRAYDRARDPKVKLTQCEYNLYIQTQSL